MGRVVVAGGGTAGFAAALGAARAGGTVTVLEQLSYLGGTMTGGLVPGIVSMRHQPWRDEETLVQMESSYAGPQVVRGVAQELVDRLNTAGAAFSTRDGEAPVRVLFDPEYAKWAIDQMLREAGVEILYDSKVVGVERNGSRVTGVRINQGDLLAADVVIDATGDGDVAHLAGADYEQGERGDKTYVQPISLYFLLGGVDLDRTIARINEATDDFTPQYVAKLNELRTKDWPFTVLPINSVREKAVENGDYPIPFGATEVNPRAHTSICRPVFRGGKVRYDITMHNVDMAYRVDATDPRTLSEAIGSMRDFTVRTARYFQKYVPGFEESYLLQIADSVGVRETRRIVGDYMLTGTDVLNAQTFDDAVGYCGATVDVHDVEGGKEKTRMSAIREGKAYQVPFGVTLPRGLDALLVAGRCVSADRVACGSIRQQAGCIVTGQAAGAAAAMSSQRNSLPRAIAVGDLQQELRRQGVVLDRLPTGGAPA